MSKATASSIGLRQGTSNQRTLVTSPYFATGVATPTVSVPSRTSSTTTSSEAREKEKEPRDSNSHISLEYERAGAGGQPPDTETSSTTTTGASSSSSYSLEEQPPNSKRRKVEKQGAITDFFRSASNPNKPLSATPKQPSKEPPHWREHLANIQEMRKNRDAPVDHMGCGAAAEIGADGPTYRYQVLLSAMLSSQTKDQQTDAALRRLIAHGCTIDNILNTSQKDLEQLIYPVRWREKKAQYILKTTRLLKERHNSDVPNNFKDLVALPGIGPKMAHLILSIAWNNTVGISVDTHVHRISARLGWTHLKPNATPEDTRKSLEEWLPLSWWRDINKLFVGFGQTICLPVNPRCSVCLNNQICPSSSVLASSRGTSRANIPSNNPPRIGDSEVTTGGRA